MVLRGERAGRRLACQHHHVDRYACAHKRSARLASWAMLAKEAPAWPCVGPSGRSAALGRRGPPCGSAGPPRAVGWPGLPLPGGRGAGRTSCRDDGVPGGRGASRPGCLARRCRRRPPRSSPPRSRGTPAARVRGGVHTRCARPAPQLTPLLDLSRPAPERACGCRPSLASVRALPMPCAASVRALPMRLATRICIPARPCSPLRSR